MNILDDEAEEEYDMFMVAVAAYAKLSTERLPYASRRTPMITSLQRVEHKETNAQVFYSMFRMRRSVFYPLLDLLVERYGFTSTCSMSSKESIGTLFMDSGNMSNYG
jgi:hypothetical protein